MVTPPCWRACAASLLLLTLAATAAATESRGPLQASFSVAARELVIELGETAPAEVRVHTTGLDRPEMGTDVNEPGIIYLPPPPGETDPARLLAAAQNVYFFNEFVPAPGWELVLRFGATARGTWKLNGRFSPQGGEQREEVAVPLADLEPGENLLHLRGESLAVPEMYFRHRAAAGTVRLRAIPADWAGRVSLWRPPLEGQGRQRVALAEVAPSALARRAPLVPERWWEQRDNVRAAVFAAGQSIANNQVRRPGSLFDGGFHLVYDPTRRAHRMAHWVWAWGPSIDFLLRLAALDADRSRAGEFRSIALAAAERSLGFELTAPGHPAGGVSTVRWEPSRATPEGWAEYISTADSLFLAGWGWMSVYAETKDARYVRRLESLVSAAGRLMDAYPVIPQDWIVERARWTPHTLDESLFGTIGFRRLYEATRSPSVAAAGRRFLDSHLRHMGRDSGLLARAWLREGERDLWDPDIKGHAWVNEGYLDGYRLSGDRRYLERASELAAKVLACQAADGSWTYGFKQPAPGDPVDDKGTAIWAYLFYDLHRITRDPTHLAAARRALGWCLRHQYRGEDPNLDGAIYHACNMAYVRRREMTVLYTTTFFGLALLEELAVGAQP